jgi:protein tyrosine/serine phosphatase
MNRETGAATRHIPFDTVFNFRDLGGYAAAGGRTIRWRTLFRADGLYRLAGEDLVRFAELGVRTVLDLRSHVELEERGRLDAGGEVEIRWHHLSVLDVPWDAKLDAETVDPARYLADRYLEMIEAAGDNFGQALRIIAETDSAPLVFHCAAGKDRTGVLAAITLSLLGVSDDDVAADYAKSEEAVDRWRAWIRRTAPEVLEQISGMPSVWGMTPLDTMHLFLADLRERYGSVPDLAARFGVGEADVATLQAHLLE